MREEYTEYKGRRGRKTGNLIKKTGYLKKLLYQTFISVIIFSTVIFPEALGLEFGKNIKEITKSALFYTIDTSKVTQVFKNIYTAKGESSNAEKDTTAKDI